MICGALGAWAALTETGIVRHRAVAGPIDTARALFAGLEDGTLLADLSASLQRLGLGVALALAVGLPLGLFVGTSARRHRLFEPGMDFLRAIPPLLVFPLLLLTFGYGDSARVGAVAYAATLVIALHVSSGVRRAPAERVDALRAMGATRWQLLRWVHFYEVLPSCLTALRHAVSTGLVVAVVTEMVVGAGEGLGSRAVNAQIAYDAPALYAVIFVTGGIGYALGSALMAAERRIVFWEGSFDGRASDDRGRARGPSATIGPSSTVRNEAPESTRVEDGTTPTQ